MSTNRPQSNFSTADLIESPEDLYLMGIQGSGKGTQAKRLVKYGGYRHFEMGGVLRENADRMVDVGGGKMKSIGEIQEAGEFVPMHEVMKLATEFVVKATQDGVKRIMMDGLPRGLDQDDALTAVMMENDRLKDHRVLHIDVSDATARKSIRMRAAIENRPDDAKPATVEKRINGYHTKTAPVIARYEQQGGVVLKVDGETGLDFDHPTKVANRLSVLRAIPIHELNGERGELDDLEGEWKEDIQPRLAASIDEVYFRVLQAIQADRRGDRKIDSDKPVFSIPVGAGRGTTLRQNA